MEAVPLIPKAKILPNLDAAPLLRELFQDEFQAVVPTRKYSQNILTALKSHKDREEDPKTFNDVDFLENFTSRRDGIIEFTRTVLEAHKNHEEKLREISEAEKHLFETHVHFLQREAAILEDRAIRDLLILKRQPLFKSLDTNYVRKYKLLQGEAGLPLEYELKSDFRVRNFKKWKKRLESISQDSLIMGYINMKPPSPRRCRNLPKKEILYKQPSKLKTPQKSKAKEGTEKKEIFKANPPVVFFTDFKLGEIYVAEIKVKNTHSKKVKFQLKPMNIDGPFRVNLNDETTTTVFSGLSFCLTVEFTPKSLDNAAEDVIISTDDGNRFLIPLIAYLEPPVLKTHKEINEMTKVSSEKIVSSYIECGACFTGDTKVIKLKFRCYRGSGEFFIMSSDDWSRSYIKTVTNDNLLEIPPFRIYPVYFKMEKDEVIDLFVEFMPKNSGMHVENIVIACDNGQIRTLDIIGDAVGWHSYYFSFQESLLKELPAEADDDVKVKYYLDFKDASTTGKIEKVFYVSNNSDMSFEFQWKIREANIMNPKKFLKLTRYQVKINPENGTFEPNSIWEFLVTITFDNADIGNYRMVLSLYVLNFPYQCIEEDNTIIQPTGFVRNLYSQSLYGEEEGSALSPELASLQGTYESLQESIKSYVECQNKIQAVSKADFCKNVCIPNPGLCAKPLKKSRTFFNIGDTIEEVDVCVCRHKPEADSNSESCISNSKEERTNETPPQRNEVIWDFVDILVNEIELLAEVVPTRVTLEPSVVRFNGTLNINEEPIFKSVRIINHNRSAVKCSWIFPSEVGSLKKLFPVFLGHLYDKKTEDKNRDFSNITLSSKIQSQLKPEDDKLRPSENKASDPFEIIISPQETFIVGGLSEYICEIGISANQPVKIKEMLCLSVNEGDLNLNLMILGTAVVRSIDTSPDIIDFGVLRQGTRYTKDFVILNQSPNALSWNVNEFKFDFCKEYFLAHSSAEAMEHIKKTKGVLEKQGNSTTESCCIDARVPGIRCSILEIKENKPKNFDPGKQYILVLGDVKLPRLSLSAPRFENAILAPSGMMYVGQKIITRIILTNTGPMETFCTWGHSFGCHCRKIKVEISPKSCRIESKQKLTVNVELIALEKGIISHCYIPCFFCRSLEPLILSIVAVAENLNVTFEIIDYPMQTHTDTRTFLKSPFYHTVLRIPWPTKISNPVLSLKYIKETDARSMVCHCLEIEEAALRAFGESKRLLGSVPEIQNKLAPSEKTTRSIQSLEASCESPQSSPLKNLSSKSSKTIDEGLKISNSNISGSCASDSKKSEENPKAVYTYAESSSQIPSLSKPQLEFLNIPYKTAILRQFAIRNETPIETTFEIKVSNYGVSENLPSRRLEMIKNRVFGNSTVDEFHSKLVKKQPLVMVVEPSQGELKAFDAICINVYCYGNTWGEYRDELICKVKGIEDYHLKMMIQIVGHPIYFPMFKSETSPKPTLRFQSVTFIEKVATKQIKVVNRSAIPLNISWLVFLKKPFLGEEEREDSLNLGVDSNLESNHSGEESTQSSKYYIPKNASENGSIFPLSKDFSQHSELVKSLPKTASTSSTLSMKKERGEFGESEKKISVTGFSENAKSEFQMFLLPGRPDSNVFKVEPKEMTFDPFEEKKMSITFDQHFWKPDEYPQEYLAVLTCCVKLAPEDEKCPELYFRPCGINFVSELLDFSAVVELPLVSFEILKGDLKFTVDANAVLKSKTKSVRILRKFLIKNKNEKSVTMTIEISPGNVFKVKSVNLLDKFYPAYNPDIHNLKIEPGHLMEVELECLVTYKDILYAFEQLKRNIKKDFSLASSNEIKESNFNKITKDKKEGEQATKKEPWMQCAEGTFKRKDPTDNNLGHRDSFEINLNRMSLKSTNSVCFDSLYGQGLYNEESLGEYLELPKGQEILNKPSMHITNIVEDISFVQSRLATQTLSAELQLSFPAIKVSPKNLDFGNVYLGENAARNCSIINLGGFPTDFRVVAKMNSPEFKVSPLSGKLPASDCNSEIGRSITIEFKPSEPGYYQETYKIYCNADLEFDFYEIFVFGLGTWNEKYKSPKFQMSTKFEGIYPDLQK